MNFYYLCTLITAITTTDPMSMKRANIAKFGIALFAAAIFLACSPSVQYTTIEGSALGTSVVVKCNTTAEEQLLVSLIADIDHRAKSSMSIFDKESLLSRINDNRTDSLDQHIAYNIELAKRLSILSGGVYDITVKPLTDAWGFARREEQSARPNIDSLLSFVGYEKIAIADGRIVKSDPRTELDLNSIAKGYTVDMLSAELEALGISDYMVNIGGEIRCRGLNPRGEKWSIGIETPYDGNYASDAIEKIIEVSDCAVATSGNYRRFYLTDDGRKITHTLNPHTGESVVSDLLSVTVIAPTCAEADAAATMFMAMGSEGGALELAKRCEADFGWRYYFIYADGEGYRIEASPTLK